MIHPAAAVAAFPVGTAVVFPEDVERAMNFIVPAGTRGTVTRSSVEEGIWVRCEDPVPGLTDGHGLKEWGGEFHWSLDDMAADPQKPIRVADLVVRTVLVHFNVSVTVDRSVTDERTFDRARASLVVEGKLVPETFIEVIDEESVAAPPFVCEACRSEAVELHPAMSLPAVVERDGTHRCRMVCAQCLPAEDAS